MSLGCHASGSSKSQNLIDGSFLLIFSLQNVSACMVGVEPLSSKETVPNCLLHHLHCDKGKAFMSPDDIYDITECSTNHHCSCPAPQTLEASERTDCEDS